MHRSVWCEACIAGKIYWKACPTHIASSLANTRPRLCRLAKNAEKEVRVASLRCVHTCTPLHTVRGAIVVADSAIQGNPGDTMRQHETKVQRGGGHRYHIKTKALQHYHCWHAGLSLVASLGKIGLPFKVLGNWKLRLATWQLLALCGSQPTATSE